MITIYDNKKGDNPREIHEMNGKKINDIRDTLSDGQFLIGAGRDAKRCLMTMGTSNVKMERIFWDAPRLNRIYDDFVFTL